MNDRTIEGICFAFRFVHIYSGGIAGSLLGTLIMKKISPKWLKRIFGGFMIYAGARLLCR